MEQQPDKMHKTGNRVRSLLTQFFPISLQWKAWKQIQSFRARRGDAKPTVSPHHATAFNAMAR